MHAAAVALLLALSALILSAPTSGLSHTGVPVEVWKQVLQDEPYRHIEILGEISETPGRLTRTFFSEAHKRAARRIVKWMEDAGMSVWRDAIGNVHGLLTGTDPEAGEVLIGSHYDTVVDGGKWDGTLGVLLAVAATKGLVVEALHRKGKLQQLLDLQLPGDDLQVPRGLGRGLLPVPIHIVAFADEEGIRFKSTFLGSRAVAGTLIRHGQLNQVDGAGVSLEDVLRNNGLADPAAAMKTLALNPDKVRHYIEFHIEQGPILEAKGVPLGVVAGIAGQTWLSVSVEGSQGHAGTVPMSMRTDPLAAAALAIAAIEATCRGEPLVGLGTDASDTEVLDVAGENLVCTVGRLLVYPGQVNMIPRWANFTIDVRCRSDALRTRVVAAIERRIAALCAARGVSCGVAKTHEAAAVLSDGVLMAKLKAGVEAAQPLLAAMLPAPGSAGGSSVGQVEVPVMVSGAGHDAMAIRDLTGIAMVFVRCKGGVSHNPDEDVAAADVAAAAAAMASYLELDVLDAGKHPEGEFASLEFTGKGGAGRDEL